ncbi:MAG TPA: sugar phosphate nucleotidyltransferase [Steroidobacteraceae bacterium]|jgi:mannose-1-phosphate guanylyltransferase
MTDNGKTWALVLAGGEGSRLRALTTQPGERPVPKQFCSLNGGRTLLEDAIARASTITSEAFIYSVVAEQHREWWAVPLAHLPPGNVIAQPRSRGTAVGILYPLLHILARDPDARIVLLPSDHCVRQESVLRQSVQEALSQLARNGGAPTLLGLQPTEADPDFGYILPGELAADGGRTIRHFVEKPPAGLASQIIARGGLWNTFIIAASGQSLLNLFQVRYPQVVAALHGIVAVQGQTPQDSTTLQCLFERLPQLDFSRDILEVCCSALRLACVPACGWSDLGTPQRVADALRRLDPSQLERDTVSSPSAPINLALRYAHLERAGKFAGLVAGA